MGWRPSKLLRTAARGRETKKRPSELLRAVTDTAQERESGWSQARPESERDGMAPINELLGVVTDKDRE